MGTLVLTALAAAAVWAWHRHRNKSGAGASAARHARQLRTPLVRLATAAGIRTRAEERARRFDTGATGERATAKLIDPLKREGWTILHDRRLPSGNANVDHLAISEAGTVYMPDTKKWSSRYPITVRNGRLWHGDRDVTDRLNGVYHEQQTVARVLGVPVTPIIAMDGAPLHDAHGRPVAELTFNGVRIVPAHRIADVLRTAGQASPTFRSASIPGQRRAAELARTAEQKLPAYR